MEINTLNFTVLPKSWRRVLLVAFVYVSLALAIPGLLSALAAGQSQNAVVKRDVVLHESASKDSEGKASLKPDDRLQVLDSKKEHGYFHVRTDAGQEGWVYWTFISLASGDNSTSGNTPTSGQAADSIPTNWDKPKPEKSSLVGVDGNCPWNGDDSDPDTFVRKNRPDVPASYHDLSWQAIAKLAYPVAKPLRKNWTDSQLKEIQPYEGASVRTVGYLVAYKPQSGGNGEGTNCHFNKPAETDTHLALVEKAGDEEKSSVVIEFTPRFLQAHPNWNRKKLAPWIKSDQPVRISGWLMIDPDHRNHLTRFRSTLWEIHPITKIEVWKDNNWADLDTVN